MLEHLHAMFGVTMKGAIEIAWTRNDRLSEAEVFDVSELERAANFACVKNQEPGCNVYVGLAIRKPSTARTGRTKDDDYFETVCVSVDLDAAGAFDKAKALCDELGLKPTFGVLTGHHPHDRAQLYWRLDDPRRDPELHVELQRGLAATFGGDTTVTNPGRLMRLGGSTAWAKKPGRRDEMTELLRGSGLAYPSERLKAIASSSRTDPERNHAPSKTKTSKLGLTSANSNLDKILHEAKISGRWHDSVVRLAAALVARGLPDSVILALAPALTMPSFSIDQTERELQVMIDGAREKGFAPDASEEETPDQADAAADFDIETWDVADRFGGPAPELEWLIENVLETGSIGVVAGMGGIGKSFLALDACFAIAYPPAFGQAYVFGNPVARNGSVIFITAEDDADSIHRRIAALTAAGPARRRAGRLFVIPLLNQQGVAPIVSTARSSGLKTSSSFANLVDQIQRFDDLQLIVLDPLQAFVHADLNDPATSQYFWRVMGELAATTGAAILCTHHMNKDALSASKLEEARRGIRGNTGIVDGARMAYALWRPADEEARKLALAMNLDPEDAEFVMGGVAKINGPGDKRQHVFLRRDDGLLENVTDQAAEAHSNDGRISESMARAIANEIERAWNDGKPWSLFPQSKPSGRFFPAHAKRKWNIDQKVLQSLIDDWMATDIVAVETNNTSSGMSGLKLLQKPW